MRHLITPELMKLAKVGHGEAWNRRNEEAAPAQFGVELEGLLSRMSTCRTCEYRRVENTCRNQPCTLLPKRDRGIHYDVIHGNQAHPDSRCPLNKEVKR